MLTLSHPSSWAGTRINKKIWHLAWPMILANISIPLLGFVDTAVIGHLSESHFLAGTALASMFISVLFWLLGFLRMSTTGLVAQAKGQNDINKAVTHLYQALLLSVGLATLLIVFQSPLFALLQIFTSDNPGMTETYRAAETYFDIRIWVAPFALANMALTGYLIGSGKTKWVLKALLVCNLVNLVADLIFVPVLGFGVAGVAFASVLAEVVQFAMIFWLIRPELNSAVVKLEKVLKGWLRLLQMNGNLFLRSALLQACLSFMTIYATQFGSQTVAINSILMQFFLFLSFALDGVAFALESLVGNAWGQNKWRRLKTYAYQGMKIGLSFATLYLLIYVLFTDAIIWLITDIEPLKSALTDYYLWIYLMPLCCFLSFLMDGIFVGLGWDKQMRNSMFIAAICFFVAVFALNHLGNHALWFAFCVFMLARGLSQSVMLKGYLNVKSS